MNASFPITANKTAWKLLHAWASQMKQTKQAGKPRLGMTVQSELRLRSDPEAKEADGLIRNMTGGLGILAYDHFRAAMHPEMQLEDFGFIHTALAHTVGRGNQHIEGISQVMTNSPWSLESKEFLPLGEIGQVGLREGNKESVYGFLFTPSFDSLNPENTDTMKTASPVVVFATQREGITNVFYPPNGSTEALESQMVLGYGSFLLGKLLGLFGGVDPLATAIVQDCHGAFITHAMLEDHLETAKEETTNGKAVWELALHRTRRQCITTIHAPQPGTVYSYGESVLKRVFSNESINRLFNLGHGQNDWKILNTLNLALELSFGNTCVSQAHYEMTLDPDNALVPPHVLARYGNGNRIFTNTANIANPKVWASASHLNLLDDFFPGWRSHPDIFKPENVAGTLGRVMYSQEWRERLLGVQAEGRVVLLHALETKRKDNPGLLPAEIPENAIILGAMRRATEYKLNLLIKLLDSQMAGLTKIASHYGPLLLLFGGLAPDRDGGSEAALANLLGLIQRINAEGEGNLLAGFWTNYNEYNSHIVFGGVDMWGMFSDSLSPYVSDKEAFGPSVAKASLLGKLPIGFSDGWAPHYNLAGRATTIVPPYTHLHGLDAGKDLRKTLTRPSGWDAAAAAREGLARQISGDAFVFHFGNLCAWLREERNLSAEGQGHLAYSLVPKTAAIVNALANFHPTRLLKDYRSLAFEIRGLPDEVPIPS